MFNTIIMMAFNIKWFSSTTTTIQPEVEQKEPFVGDEEQWLKEQIALYVTSSSRPVDDIIIAPRSTNATSRSADAAREA